MTDSIMSACDGDQDTSSGRVGANYNNYGGGDDRIASMPTHHQPPPTPIVVIFVGDVHIKHKNLEDVGRIGTVVVDRIRERNRRGSDDGTRVVIVLAGDLLDTHDRVDVQLMNAAYALVRQLRDVARTYILVGNHDMINNRQFNTDAHWMNGMKEWENVVIVDRPTRMHERTDIALVQYVPPGRFAEALVGAGMDVDGDDATIKCIFAHQEFRGCKMGAIISRDGDEWPETNAAALVVSGHIHENQRPQTNVYYPGAALSHAYGHAAGSSGAVFEFEFNSVGRIVRETRVPIVDADSMRTVDIESRHLAEYMKRSLSSPSIIATTRYRVVGSAIDLAVIRKTAEFKLLERMAAKVVVRVREEALDHQQQQQRQELDVTVVADRSSRAKDATSTFECVLARMVCDEADDRLTNDYRAVVLEK